MGRRPGIDTAGFVGAILLLAFSAPAFAVTCTTQSQMAAGDRAQLEQTALALAAHVQAGDTAAVKAETIAAVTAQFDGIANTIAGIHQAVQHATLTVDELYALDATDLKAAEDAEFFCALPASTLTVEISIPNLPPGKYALAVVHATGVKNPQALSMVVEKTPAGSGNWKLAGFFVRPMTMGGHDGVWFWRQAREYAAKKQLWDAYFYYQTAQFLLDPVDFLSSPNLEKLQREAEQSRPDGLPGANPIQLNAGGQTLSVTNLHTGELSDELELVVEYQATPNQDPVAARAQVTAVMRALLALHPELRSAFHGLWVYANTANNQHPFALELPMDQIQTSSSSSPSQPGQLTTNEGKATGQA
ncbi:MAG TPA: hypothetical protein VMD92_02950 [Acidobacteriaceae bacterium]|nr:hypothetical protein [Acidobacteriaceae bacterium]